MLGSKARSALLVMSATIAISSNTTWAVNIPAGYDYLLTQPGTEFNSPFGLIPLKGRPINPSLYGQTDTIIHRLAPALFPLEGSNIYPGASTSGTEVTIPIEMVALELESVAPIDIGGSFFDVWVTLDTNTPSTGTMTISHEWADSSDLQPEGIFDSFFDVFAVVQFIPVAVGSSFQLPVHLELSSQGNLWTHDPFFILNVIEEIHPGVGVHRAVQIPEARSLVLCAVVFGMISVRYLRRSVTQAA